MVKSFTGYRVTIYELRDTKNEIRYTKYEEDFMNESFTHEITLRDYLRVLFRQKAIIITCIITVIATVAFGLKMKTKQYQASVKMLISAEKQVASPYYRDLMIQNQQVALTQSEIVKSTPVLERVVNSLSLYMKPLDYEAEYSSTIKAIWIRNNAKKMQEKLDKLTYGQQRSYRFRMALEELKKQITIEPIRDTNLFRITVTDYSPDKVAAIANSISRSYVMFDLEQQRVELHQQYGDKHPMTRQINDAITFMGKTLKGEPIQSEDAIGPASVKIVEQAQQPILPIGASKIMILLLGCFMAPFLGVMLAFMFDYMDHTFKSPKDIEDYLSLPLLGSISKKKFLNKELFKKAKQSTAYKRSYSTLSEQIFLLSKDRNIKTIMVNSTSMNEGASTIVANVGTYFAHHLHKKVLLIDANLRHSSLHKKFKNVKKAQISGLSEIVEGKLTFVDAIHKIDENMDIIVSGRTDLNPITLLESSTMKQVLKLAKEKYDIVLVDAANLGAYTDAYMLTEQVDGVIIVVKEGRTKRQIVRRALEPFKDEKVNVLGVVLNSRTYPIPRLIYNRV